MSAPIGGLNTLNPGGDMPPTDCISLTNMTSSDLGLRARLGWREWCTGIPEAEVRSLLQYNGSARNASQDKLFACTSAGIYDVTSSSNSPTKVVTFPVQTSMSGTGASYAMVTAAGHFLIYTDEENGYYIYIESLGLWQKVVSATQSAWVINTNYTAGQYVTNGGNVYLCTVSGMSAGAGGPTGTTLGANITDNTCTWQYNLSVSGVDPAQFVHVTAWKSKAWFVQKNTAQGWWLATNAIAGAATNQNFGSQSRAGGSLIGLYNWTAEGGVTLDDRLVAITDGGDVEIWQGTDPSSPTTFGLVGVWYVGGLVSGRRVATEIGGDMMLLSNIGLVPLSGIISGGIISDRSQYLTDKISNLFNSYVSAYGTNAGWGVVLHPEDNTIVVLVPSYYGSPNQLAMGVATKGWGLYSGLNMLSATPWNGKLYFGTTDGRVCQNTGYADGVLLSNPSAFTAIQWSLLTSFQNLGSPKKKRVHWIRPYINCQASQPTYQAVARFDFDTGAQANVSPSGLAVGSAWDTAIWDTDTWAGDYVPSENISGSGGMGAFVAIGVKGTATSKTVLAGIDVGFDVGGPL